MNKVISILGLFLIFSCGNLDDGYKNKSQSNWIVSEIEYKSPTTATYFAKTTDSTELAENNTWFADTIGTFRVGDTLIFAKKK